MNKDLSSLTHFGFLTLPRFSMIAFSNAVEVLRMANYVSGEALYRWSVYSTDGAQVAASNGLAVTQTSRFDERVVPLPDVLFVCGGLDVGTAVDGILIRALRAAARVGVPLGGLCTGSYALAKAGLLNGYRCATHWENISAHRELFPQIEFSSELFAIDRDRYTCTGGTASLDLMLNIVTSRIGKRNAAVISNQFIIERIRDGKERQHISLAARLGFHHRAMSDAAALMEVNLEEPLSLDEIARLVHLSQRQLQRMFRQHLKVTPAQYYLHLRLHRARELLLQTNMSITDVAVACGFRSRCHFSKSYRAFFKRSPGTERGRPCRSPAVHAAPEQCQRVLDAMPSIFSDEMSP